jgi:magnesium transporter
VIIDCAVYSHGERLDGPRRRDDFEVALHDARAASGFVWLGLYEPSQGELQGYADALGLHELAVEDAVNARQRPKIERYGDVYFVVLRTLQYTADDTVETGEVAMFVGPDYLVTVRHGNGQGLEGLRHGAEAQADVLGNGAVAGFHAVMDGIVDRYGDVLAELEIDVNEVEQSVFAEERSRDSERIYLLKRELLETRNAVQPLREPLRALLRDNGGHLAAEVLPFFRDIADHVVRVSEQVDSLDHMLDNALSAHLAQISIQQNEDVRKVSAWAALLVAPTLVASIYGMNFEVMPELEWTYGYGFALGLMVVTVVLLYRAFKRSGWL